MVFSQRFGVVVIAFLLLVPFTLLGATVMTLVASFTKSYKEAANLAQRLLLALRDRLSEML